MKLLNKINLKIDIYFGFDFPPNMIKFRHFTNSPLSTLIQKETKEHWIKPSGFWFCKNNEWKDWCLETGFSTFYFEYDLEIDFSNILIIDSFEKLKTFCKKFNRNDGELGIDWAKVSANFDGIYFDNFNDIKAQFLKDFSLLKKHSWYLAIDVNSGCIFNIKCVKVL